MRKMPHGSTGTGKKTVAFSSSPTKTTASASMPLRMTSCCCPANGAPVSYHLAIADGRLVYRTADAAGARELLGVLWLLVAGIVL